MLTILFPPPAIPIQISMEIHRLLRLLWEEVDRVNLRPECPQMSSSSATTTWWRLAGNIILMRNRNNRQQPEEEEEDSFSNCSSNEGGTQWAPQQPQCNKSNAVWSI